VFLTTSNLPANLDAAQRVERLRNSGLWKQLSWMCVVFLLLMSSAQAAHVCQLTDDFQPSQGSAAQMTAPVSHSFCAICASSHSPSLAAPFVSLASLESPAEPSLARNAIERSVSPQFALYIRPPPAC
jgi:hypothetical protein